MTTPGDLCELMKEVSSGSWCVVDWMERSPDSL